MGRRMGGRDQKSANAAGKKGIVVVKSRAGALTMPYRDLDHLTTVTDLSTILQCLFSDWSKYTCQSCVLDEEGSGSWTLLLPCRPTWDEERRNGSREGGRWERASGSGRDRDRYLLLCALVSMFAAIQASALRGMSVGRARG